MKNSSMMAGCLILSALLGCETAHRRMPPPQQMPPTRVVVAKPKLVPPKQEPKKPAVMRYMKDDIAKRDVVLRPFALRETPSIWRSIQNLRVESEVLGANYKKLEAELREFGRNPEQDSDLKKIKTQKATIDEMHDRVYLKLEDAYIAAAKYEAAPSSKEYENLKRKTIADGVAEAELTTQKFNSLRKEK